MENKFESSIIIRTRNNKKLLGDLLSKIKLQENVAKPEIVIVDSSSTDGTKEFAIKEGCKVITINPKDFDHSSSLNIGAKNSRNEILVYTSVDIIPKNNLWLSHLIKHFADKNIAGVFGKQEPIPNFNPIEEFKVKRIFPDKEKSIALFSCASGAIRKSVWKKVKYDENLPYKLMGGQDQTWVLEVEKLGYDVIYEPKSIVYHSHKYPTKSRIKTAYVNGFYKKEVDEFNKGVKMLKFKKMDLIKFLIKKKKFKDLFFDLLFVGVLLRIVSFYGQIKRKRYEKKN